ncbi:hypothetical protein SAMN05444004_1376 [Jannaschia faecimaris]|uniref:Uncharacterized protein n=1 Tax=Jannaschia faecimaris TaxID=1244108 RepID=A0A1H3UHZ2_9RHOB|nr:hypothetical protein SAMN05444004_1376 [Jannaschia faecimaris]
MVFGSVMAISSLHERGTKSRSGCFGLEADLRQCNRSRSRSSRARVAPDPMRSFMQHAASGGSEPIPLKNSAKSKSAQNYRTLFFGNRPRGTSFAGAGTCGRMFCHSDRSNSRDEFFNGIRLFETLERSTSFDAKGGDSTFAARRTNVSYAGQSRLMRVQRNSLQHVGRVRDRVAAAQHNSPEPDIHCISNHQDSNRRSPS